MTPYREIKGIGPVMLGFDSGTGGVIRQVANIISYFEGVPPITNKDIAMYMQYNPEFLSNYYLGQGFSLLGLISSGGNKTNSEPALVTSNGTIIPKANTITLPDYILRAEKNNDERESKPSRSEHAEQRAQEGRPVSAARGDDQNAKRSEIYVQDDGRWVVKGDNGRLSVFESDGEHVTTFKNPQKNTDMRVRSGRYSRPTESQYEQFSKLFGNNSLGY